MPICIVLQERENKTLALIFLCLYLRGAEISLDLQLCMTPHDTSLCKALPPLPKLALRHKLTPPCTTLLHLPVLPRCSHPEGHTAPSPVPSPFPASTQGLVLFLAQDRLGGRAVAVRAIEAKLLLKAT